MQAVLHRLQLAAWHVIDLNPCLLLCISVVLWFCLAAQWELTGHSRMCKQEMRGDQHLGGKPWHMGTRCWGINLSLFLPLHARFWDAFVQALQKVLQNWTTHHHVANSVNVLVLVFPPLFYPPGPYFCPLGSPSQMNCLHVNLCFRLRSMGEYDLSPVRLSFNWSSQGIGHQQSELCT